MGLDKFKKQIVITNTAIGIKKLNVNILKSMVKEIASVFKSKK